MNGKDIVLDTNILLYFLNGDSNVRQFLDDYNPILSFVSELELLSAPEISEAGKLFIKELLEDITIIKYSEEHKEDIIKLRAAKKLKLPDAIIAALSITLGVPLIAADNALRNIQWTDVVFYKTPDNG
jgi:predicted nucleic acid-binding protein